MEWTLADIRKKVRQYTGLLATQQIADAVIDDAINDFYVNEFPLLVSSTSLSQWYEFNTTAGAGEYPLEVDILNILSPVYVNDYPLFFTRDRGLFFGNYPLDEPAQQGKPFAAFLDDDRTLYLRPVPDAEYNVRVLVVKKPTALVNDTDKPLDPAWGRAVAVGAAIHLLLEEGDKDAANELSDLLGALLGQINRKATLFSATKEAIRSF